MRLFAALPLPPPVVDWLDVLGAVARDVDPTLRWVPAEQWHLTLAFFGDVPDRRVDDLTVRLARAAARTSTLSLALGPPGTFGSVRRARVLWQGLSSGAEATSRLAASCRAAGRRAGLTGDDLAPTARFRAHVTLARASPPRDVEAVLAALRSDTYPSWSAHEARLVRSTLGAGPRGRAQHDVLASFGLRSSPFER